MKVYEIWTDSIEGEHFLMTVKATCTANAIEKAYKEYKHMFSREQFDAYEIDNCGDIYHAS